MSKLLAGLLSSLVGFVCCIVLAVPVHGEEEITLENSGFEKEPSSEKDIPAWDYWSGGYKEGATISREEVYEGNRSLKIDNKGVLGLFSQEVGVTPGNHYTLTAQLFVKEISGNPGIWLRWTNEEGTIIKNDAKYFENVALHEWQEVLVEADAPPNATGLKVLIYQTSNTTMTGYYDDLMLVEEASDPLELPFEFGEPINKGPAALAAKTQGAAIGDGELYYATNGSPATFYATDEETGEVIYSEDLPGSDVVWGMTVASDGNVYFSGTYNGYLYRYVTGEQRVEKIGVNPSDDWVWELEATEDGKVYGATYPNAKVFEYDIASDSFSDLGSFSKEQQYARGLGVTEQHLYVGIGTEAYLYQMDRDTGETKEIELPITGIGSSVSNIWEYGEKLFVAYGTSLLIMDVSTGEVIKQIPWSDKDAFDGLISPPSPYDENIVYFVTKNGRELRTFNLQTNEIATVDDSLAKLPASRSKAMEWTKAKDGTNVLSIIHQQIEYSVYNPKTKEVTVSYPDVDMQGLITQSLEISPDNDIYLSGYQGSIARYDTHSEAYVLQERDPHQIEGMGFLNGKVYMGAYGGARIYEYDPEKDYQFTGEKNGNPKLVHDIQDAQSRPFTFTSGEDKLFIGTIADYGELGGAFTIYNSKQDTWETKRNIIKDQSIIGLAYHEGTVFGGSTIAGGLGISPTAKEAKMFAYQVESGEYDTFNIKLEGLETPEMIGELSIGPDNLLWGVAWGFNTEGKEQSVLFAMNPTTKEILKSTLLYEGVHRGSQWRPFYIRWDDNGLLYTTAARKLTVVDPETMRHTQLIGDDINLMDLDEEGNIYYAKGSDLYKLPVLMDKVSITIDQPSLTQGEKIQPNVIVTLSNGKEASFPQNQIEWSSSSLDIASIEEGSIHAHNAGSTTIQASVTYNNQSITSNELEITVQVTTQSLSNQLDDMKDEGSLPHSLFKKLNNRLRQAEHHFQKGRTQQATHQVEKFKEHIHKSDISEETKQILLQNANALVDTW
ncbi:hypothetical protein ACFFGV_14105 [Pontibacillus salicampi]|uniref:FIMAH domain-containing protein n=1 Tax=Pontibacillus salicampi TaxID=1449801 RepID=A0ABV6LQL7_9BACI